MRREFKAMTKAVLYFLMNVGEAVFYISIAYIEYLLVKWIGIHAIWVFILWVGTILAMGSCILRKVYLLHEDVKKLKEDIQVVDERVCQDILPKLGIIDSRSNLILRMLEDRN